jgi:fission process protein 1
MNHPNNNNVNDGAGPYNIFRDSTLRYCGYANEVGESFRLQYPKFVIPSYLIAFCYCLADSALATYSVMSEDDDTIAAKETKRPKNVRAAIAGFDTLLWQGLASVAIPGGVINLIVRSSRMALTRTVGLPTFAIKWFPTALGLCSIPVIIHPIDDAVDFLLDNSTRKWLKDVHVKPNN